MCWILRGSTFSDGAALSGQPAPAQACCNLQHKVFAAALCIWLQVWFIVQITLTCSHTCF